VLFSDSKYLPLPDALDFFHWHHPEEFLFNSWHGLLLIFAISYTIILSVRSMRRMFQNSRKAKLLHAVSEVDDNGFYQLDTDTPTAFTAGYSQPRCYITSALRSQLNQDEYTIVQLHEIEHARRHDPLQKWAFLLLTSFFPRSVSNRLNQLLLLAMEQNADSAVSRVVKDKSKIAETLLKVRRLTAKSFGNSLDSNAFCHFGNDNLNQRIRYLLSDQQENDFPMFMVGLTAISMLAVCALSTDLFHHLIEYSLSH